MKTLVWSGFASGCAAACLLASAAAADPLGGKEAWDFTPQNRAAIALAIKQIEDPGAGGPTTIVCGGNSGSSGQGGTGSGASATANDACIIVSNSSGAIINSGQHSDGNQDAEASANSKTTSAHSKGTKSGGSIDEVDAILNGNKQGL